MASYIKWMNSRSKLVKILFCLPIIDILWAIYRIVGAVKNRNIIHLILGLIWVFFGPSFGWILDLASIILFDHIFWFKE